MTTKQPTEEDIAYWRSCILSLSKANLPDSHRLHSRIGGAAFRETQKWAMSARNHLRKHGLLDRVEGEVTAQIEADTKSWLARDVRMALEVVVEAEAALAAAKARLCRAEEAATPRAWTP